MLSKKTCLLLGAGASQHLGFPLASTLKTQILRLLREVKHKPPDELRGDFARSGEDLKLFYERLAYGSWHSPDAFLEKHREFVKTGKYLMCRALAEREDEWNIASNAGWYDELVESIHVENAGKLKSNGLSIITFNYDRSLDFRLHKYVENHFAIESSEAWRVLTDAIPMIHLHGILGDYPKWPYGDRTNEYERSQSIKIISEIEDGLDDFDRASDLLNDAERVVVFGFGFAPDNVRRLRFFKEQENDSREIIVAAGLGRGSAHEQECSERLGKWGLKIHKHVFMIDCNRIADTHVKPFV